MLCWCGSWSSLSESSAASRASAASRSMLWAEAEGGIPVMGAGEEAVAVSSIMSIKAERGRVIVELGRCCCWGGSCREGLFMISGGNWCC